MVIVADTSPLNYLILIGHQDILPELFGPIVAPPQVLSELGRPGSLDLVRSWSLHPPQWLDIRSPAVVDRSLELDEGELAAIALARELHADRLLIDDAEGRRVARWLGIPIAGTLAILRDAAPDAVENHT